MSAAVTPLAVEPAPAERTIEPLLPLYQRGLQLYRTGGLPRGSSTGWDAVDRHYTVGLGQWTVVTGTPGSGKSEWLDAMLVNLAEREGWVFAVYSPENHPTETHLVKLVEKRIRRPFGDGPTARMTEAEYAAGASWVLEHFMWLAPAARDPMFLLEVASAYKSKGQKFGVVLDPWNTLDHQRGSLSETDYVSLVLSSVTRLCRESNMHIWLVVHPAKLQRNRDGVRPVPGPYDLSGSSHWYNKADNILCLSRDQTKESQIVELHVQKVRFKHIGKTGLVELRYDKVTGRYFADDGFGGEDEWYTDPERGQPPPAAIPVHDREPGADDA